MSVRLTASSTANIPAQDERISTGALAGPTLCIVTVKPVKGRLKLVPAESGFLTLSSRDQSAVTKFYDECRRFCRDGGIAHLTLREPPGAGKFRASTPAFKIETMLQLVPGLALEYIHALTLNAWLRRYCPELIAPDRHLARAFRAVQLHAIELAAYIHNLRRADIASFQEIAK